MTQLSAKDTWLNTGLTYALISVFLWGAIIAVNKMVISTFHISPFLFSCFIFTYAGLTLMFIGRGHRVAKKTFTEPHTWAYGFIRVLDTILFNLALIVITATEAVLFNRISIIMTLILSRVFLSRGVGRSELPGYALIVIAYVMLALRQDGGFMNWAVWCVTLAALGNSILAFLIEIHPSAQKSIGVRARCSYTGVILLVSSVCFAIIFSALYFLTTLPALQGEFTTTLAQFLSEGGKNPLLNPQMHLFAFLVGVCLMAPTMYATFYAIRLINADNMLMAGTLIPLSSFMFESILSLFGLVDISTLSGGDLLLGVLITTGALYAFSIRMKKKLR